MSNFIVFANNASSTLASAILSSDLTLTVNTGDGTIFPILSAGQIMVITLEDTSGNIEVVWGTARTTDTITILRGQEGTTPAGFASGSRVELRVTAGILAALLQKGGGDTTSGTTTVTGILALGSAGSIQGGEIAGTAVRGSPGETDNQFLVPPSGGAPTIGGSTVLTASNFAGQLPGGVGLVLTGMILFWSGASNAIPTGYVLCDGSHGTPNLLDQFIVGGGGSLPTSGGANSGETGTSVTGNTISGTTLTIDQIPGHSHDYWLSGVTFSSNGHPGVIGIDAGGAYTTNLPTYSGGPPANTPFIKPTGGSSSGTISAANPHTHTVTDGGHNHSVTLPPYRAVFAIMKT